MNSLANIYIDSDQLRQPEPTRLVVRDRYHQLPMWSVRDRIKARGLNHAAVTAVQLAVPVLHDVIHLVAVKALPPMVKLRSNGEESLHRGGRQLNRTAAIVRQPLGHECLLLQEQPLREIAGQSLARVAQQADSVGRRKAVEPCEVGRHGPERYA